jgi:hypothetical protein
VVRGNDPSSVLIGAVVTIVDSVAVVVLRVLAMVDVFFPQTAPNVMDQKVNLDVDGDI